MKSFPAAAAAAGARDAANFDCRSLRFGAVSMPLPDEPPSFTATPSIVPTSDGGVLFDVRLSASPPPTIQWFKGNLPLTPTAGRYTASTKTDGYNYQLTLVIGNVTKGDSGAYRVKAKNSAGESNANINLNLEGTWSLRIRTRRSLTRGTYVRIYVREMR